MIAADYGNGSATAKQTLERTFEQSTGQNLAFGAFVTKYEMPLRIVGLVTGLVPGSRGLGAVGDIVLRNVETTVDGRIKAVNDAVAKATASASVVGQQALDTPRVGQPTSPATNVNRGQITTPPGAKPNVEEKRAAQILADAGYNVEFLPTASSLGKPNERTGDVIVSGIGPADI